MRSNFVSVFVPLEQCSCLFPQIKLLRIRLQLTRLVLHVDICCLGEGWTRAAHYAIHLVSGIITSPSKMLLLNLSGSLLWTTIYIWNRKGTTISSEASGFSVLDSFSMKLIWLRNTCLYKGWCGVLVSPAMLIHYHSMEMDLFACVHKFIRQCGANLS